MPPRKRSNWRQPTVFDDQDGGRTTRAARAARSLSKSQYYASNRDGGVAINVSRSKEKVQKWVEVWRSPAAGIGFTVPQWVPLEKLTLEERKEYDKAALEKQPFQQPQQPEQAGNAVPSEQSQAESESMETQTSETTPAINPPVQVKGEEPVPMDTSMPAEQEVARAEAVKTENSSTENDALPVMNRETALGTPMKEAEPTTTGDETLPATNNEATTNAPKEAPAADGATTDVSPPESEDKPSLPTQSTVEVPSSSLTAPPDARQQASQTLQENTAATTPLVTSTETETAAVDTITVKEEEEETTEIQAASAMESNNATAGEVTVKEETKTETQAGSETKTNIATTNDDSKPSTATPLESKVESEDTDVVMQQEPENPPIAKEQTETKNEAAPDTTTVSQEETSAAPEASSVNPSASEAPPNPVTDAAESTGTDEPAAKRQRTEEETSSGELVTQSDNQTDTN